MIAFGLFCHMKCAAGLSRSGCQAFDFLLPLPQGQTGYYFAAEAYDQLLLKRFDGQVQMRYEYTETTKNVSSLCTYDLFF